MSTRYDFEPFGDSSAIDGDPEEISALGRRYSNTVAEMDKAARSLTTIKNNTDGNWQGLAGPHFRDKAGDLSSRVTQARGRYEAAGKALTAYATSLDTAQSAGALAAKAAREAQATMNANAPQPSPGPNDPPETDAQKTERSTRSTAYGNAKGDLATATTGWNNAVEAWHSAAKTCADAIGAADQHDGLKDSWWYDHWEAIKTILEIVAIIVAVVAVIALVLTCPFLLALMPGFLAAWATGTAVAGALAATLTVCTIAGAALSIAILGMDIDGKAEGQDVTTSDLVWDSLGVVLSFGGLAIGKYGFKAGETAEQIGNASSRSAGMDAAEQVFQNILRDPNFDPAALARVSAAYDAGKTFQAGAVSSALEHATPSAGDVIKYGLEDAQEFAKLKAMAQFDPAAVRAALESNGATLPALHHAAELATKPHEYEERLKTLEKMVGMSSEPDESPAISGEVKQHVMSAPAK